MDPGDAPRFEEMARDPRRPEAAAAQLWLLRRAAERARWQELRALLDRLPTVESIAAYRRYLAALALERASAPDALRRFVRSARGTFGAYARAVEALVVRRVSAAPAPSAIEWLEEVLGPARAMGVLEEIASRLLRARRARGGCAVAQHLSKRAPPRAELPLVECALAEGDLEGFRARWRTSWRARANR